MTTCTCCVSTECNDIGKKTLNVCHESGTVPCACGSCTLKKFKEIDDAVAARRSVIERMQVEAPVSADDEAADGMISNMNVCGKLVNVVWVGTNNGVRTEVIPARRTPNPPLRVLRANEEGQAFRRLRGARSTTGLLIDSGANISISKRKLDIVNSHRDVWIRGIQGRSKCHEQGEVCMWASDESGVRRPVKVENAHYVPDCLADILSVSAATRQGNEFHFVPGKSYMTDVDGNKYELTEKDGLYFLKVDDIYNSVLRYSQSGLPSMFDGSSDSGTNHMTCVLDGKEYACAASLDLWHERLGHISKNKVKVIFEKKLATGTGRVRMQSAHPDHCLCDVCELAKAHKRPIYSRKLSPPQKRAPFERVVTDLCGDFEPDCHGNRYFIGFVCAETHFSYTALLKSKGEAKDALIEFLDWLRENQFAMPKELLSDVGGEFVNTSLHHNHEVRSRKITEFDEVLKGINCKHLLTAAHASQFAGLAERYNGNMKILTNSLLCHADLSHPLWGDAVAHAGYLRNRIPTRALGVSPYQCLYQTAPPLDRVKVFGADAYAWDAYQPKGRFRARAKRYIYIGVPQNSAGYLLLDPITRQRKISYHVTINESFANRRRMLRELDIDLAADRLELSGSGGGDDSVFDFEPDSELDLQRLFRYSDAAAFRRLFRIDDTTWDIMKVQHGDAFHEGIQTYSTTRPDTGEVDGFDVDGFVQSEPGSDGSSESRSCRGIELHQDSHPGAEYRESDDGPDLGHDMISDDGPDLGHDILEEHQDGGSGVPRVELMRPVRYVGRSKAQKITDEDRVFLKLAEEQGIRMVYRPDNPKRGMSAQRYAKYSKAQTIGEFYDIMQKEFDMSRGTAKKWLEHDYARGFQLFPGHEPNAAAHASCLSVSSDPPKEPRFTESDCFNDILVKLFQRDGADTERLLQCDEEVRKFAYHQISKVMAAVADDRLQRLSSEPRNLKEALYGPDKDIWIPSMLSEWTVAMASYTGRRTLVP